MTPTPQLTALLLLLLAAVPEASERPTGWTEVRTAHVTVKTDLGQEDARRAALLAERIRNALLAAAWPGSKLRESERLELLVLADHVDFVRQFGVFLAGELMHLDYPPTAFLYGPPETWEKRGLLGERENGWPGSWTSSVLKHEMAHHVADFFYRRQPKWFAEGLAQFLETMRFSEDGKAVVLGDINIPALRSYRANPFNVSDAIAWGAGFDPQDEGSIGGLYGLSWLLVAWMFNTHPAEYRRFQSLLVDGIEPAKAWRVAFPDVVLGDLDYELHHFSRYGEFRTSSLPLPEADGTVRERPMTSAEVHVTHAFIALAAALIAPHHAAHVESALKEIAAALAADPGNVRALRMQMGFVQHKDWMALGRRAVAAHPDDGLAWLVLGDALGTESALADERVQAYRRAMELLPDHPAAFHALAWMDLQKGRAAEALPLAVTASQMAPWDTDLLSTLAAALAGVGRCTEAVATEARALDMVSENNGPEEWASYAMRLASLQKTCSESSAEAQPPWPRAPGVAPPP